MKCHYEVLEIERSAGDKEIKASYRKLALRWHPDKNLENLEIAKEQFQLIQQAYEVLSDPQERAWYDNHREQILRSQHSEYEEQCLDLFQYFTVTCFKGYGDDAGGFYQVYAEIFQQIATEDLEFMDDPDEISKIPTFGNSQSNYEDVVNPFYAYWQSYCTKKNYTWLCPYNIAEIKDRRILREIEKDMKKTVQKAKKERNEEVRALVSFIRKRDKRVLANIKMLEERSKINREKQEQNRLEQIRKRQKEVEEMKKQHQNSVLHGNFEDELRQLELAYGESESEDEDLYFEDIEQTEDIENPIFIDNLYCVACNKAFKNQNAYNNHEDSKKHRDNLEKLTLEMNEEESLLHKDTDSETDKFEIIEQFAVAEGVTVEADNLDIKTENKADDDIDSDIEDFELVISDLEEASVEQDKPPKMTKKSKKIKKLQISTTNIKNEELIPDLLSNFMDDRKDDWESDKKSGKKSKNKKTNQKKSLQVSASVEPKVDTTLTEKSEKISQKKCKEVTYDFGEDIDHVCVTCHTVFPSKNKLFAHLKKMDHGVYLPNRAELEQEFVNTGATKKGKRK